MRTLPSLPPAPPCLDGATSEGAKEIEAATRFYQQRAEVPHQDGPRPKSYKFKTYAHPSVRAALGAAFGGKCAYCESQLTAVAPIDVEHFRPKGGVEGVTPAPVAGLPVEPPHYFWLAATWDNLLPSCLSCNRRSTQPFEDGSSAVVGKGNFFPVEPGTARAKPGEPPTMERPLLLHPCVDAVEEHLRFHADGTVSPVVDEQGVVSAKGETTIGLLGLNRAPLVRERRRVISIALNSLMNILELQAKAAAHGDDLWFEWQIQSEIVMLERQLRLDAPYSVAVAQALGLS